MLYYSISMLDEDAAYLLFVVKFLYYESAPIGVIVVLIFSPYFLESLYFEFIIYAALLILKALCCC